MAQTEDSELAPTNDANDASDTQNELEKDNRHSRNREAPLSGADDSENRPLNIISPGIASRPVPPGEFPQEKF